MQPKKRTQRKEIYNTFKIKINIKMQQSQKTLLLQFIVVILLEIQKKNKKKKISQHEQRKKNVQNVHKKYFFI